MIRNDRKIEEKSDNLSKERIRLIIAVIGVFISLYGLVLFNQNILRDIPLIPRMAVMIVSQWGIFLVPLMLMKRNREKLSDFFISEIKPWRQIQTGIILALAMTVVLILIPILLGLEDMVGSTSYTMPWQFVFEFIYSIIGVALAEELVFRGYIFNKIVLLSGSRSTAIILSSILFGFFHVFNGNVLQIIMTFCMGMMFCYFREKIKSCTIISLIIAHGLYDGMIVLLVKFL